MATDYHKLPYVTTTEIALVDANLAEANHRADIVKDITSQYNFIVNAPIPNQSAIDAVTNALIDAQNQLKVAIAIYLKSVKDLTALSESRSKDHAAQTAQINQSEAQIKIAQFWTDHGLQIALIAAALIVIFLYFKFKK